MSVLSRGNVTKSARRPFLPAGLHGSPGRTFLAQISGYPRWRRASFETKRSPSRFQTK